MFPIFSPTKILDNLILMLIMKKGPQHGYAITSIIEEKSGWKPSQTAVYNSLKSMENENLVVVEERIEKGRAQKIYSVTEKGKQYFEETHQNMRKQMMKNFSQYFSFVQMVSEIDNQEESEIYQQSIESIIENMRIVYQILPLTLKEAPIETKVVFENTLNSLRKIATEYKIEIEKET